MSESDEVTARGGADRTEGGEPAGSGVPWTAGRRHEGGGGRAGAALIPLLVDRPRDQVGVVWLSATRDDVTIGYEFTAGGRRWVVTGYSPSGVMFTCVEMVAP